jgi:hypothetical protein
MPGDDRYASGSSVLKTLISFIDASIADVWVNKPENDDPTTVELIELATDAALKRSRILA